MLKSMKRVMSTFLVLALILAYLPTHLYAAGVKETIDTREMLFAARNFGSFEGIEGLGSSAGGELGSSTGELGSSERELDKGSVPVGGPSLFAALVSTDLNFTSINMLVDGNPVLPNVPVDVTDNVRLDYTWELDPALALNDGDTYSFTLPTAFNPGTGFTGEPVLNSAGGAQIGTLDLDAGTRIATVTFTNAAAMGPPGSGRIGTFFFQLKFAQTVIEGPPRQEIDLGFGHDVEIEFESGAIAGAIQKDGWVDPTFNSHLIRWDIDANLKYAVLDNAKVTDEIPAGLVLTAQPTKVEVYPVVVNRQTGALTVGTTPLAETIDYTYTYNSATNIVVVSFVNQINSAYRVRIYTDIEDANLHDATFTNKATITGGDAHNGGAAISLDTTATVTNTSSFGEDIHKKATVSYDGGTVTVHWEVRLNYSGANAVPAFTDQLSWNMTGTAPDWRYRPTTFKVYEVTPTGASTEAPGKIARTDFVLAINDATHSFEMKIGTANIAVDPQQTENLT